MQRAPYHTRTILQGQEPCRTLEEELSTQPQTPPTVLGDNAGHHNLEKHTPMTILNHYDSQSFETTSWHFGFWTCSRALDWVMITTSSENLAGEKMQDSNQSVQYGCKSLTPRPAEEN